MKREFAIPEDLWRDILKQIEEKNKWEFHILFLFCVYISNKSFFLLQHSRKKWCKINSIDDWIGYHNILVIFTSFNAKENNVRHHMAYNHALFLCREEKQEKNFYIFNILWQQHYEYVSIWVYTYFHFFSVCLKSFRFFFVSR